MKTGNVSDNNTKKTKNEMGRTEGQNLYKGKQQVFLIDKP